MATFISQNSKTQKPWRLAVLSTLFFAWMGYKYKERTAGHFFLHMGSKKGGQVKVPFAPDLGSILMVMLAIALMLTL